MEKYNQQKEKARTEAIAYQQDQTPKSWGEVAERVAHFEKLGKRYGLLKEFKENGII